MVENLIDPEEYIKQYIDDDSSEIQPGDSVYNISARTSQSKPKVKISIDGLVRFVTVKSEGTYLDRPINK